METKQSYCNYCMNPINNNETVCATCGSSVLEAASLPHRLMPGTLLSNKFLVGRVLGEGGFGITYIGRDINLDMRVAIKEYYPSGFVNRNHTFSDNITANMGEAEKVFEEGKERFLKEARALAHFVNEPGVVGVRDFFSENNTAYIIMDYLDGVTLKKWLDKNGNMSMDQVLNLMKPIITVLSRIHERGLIHRDISPDNIMIMEDNSPKLLDFGAAREVAGLNEMNLSVMLKPGYAPEEQYRNKSLQGAWTDIYALCATMYKCVTGVAPVDALQRLFNDELKKPSELGAIITSWQEAALLKGLSVLQKNRFQTIKELLDAFYEPSTINMWGTPDKTDTIDKESYAEDDDRTLFAGQSGLVGEQFRASETVEPVEDTVNSKPRVVGKEAMSDSEPDTKSKPQNKSKGKKPKDRKPKRLFLIFAGIGVAIFSLLVIFVLWNMVGSFSDISIAGETFKGDAESVRISKRPDMEELERLKNMPNLRLLSLSYSLGLDNETLQVVGQLTKLESLSIGGTYPTSPPAVIDLSLLKNLEALKSLSLTYIADLDLAPVTNFKTLTALSIYDSRVTDFSPLLELPELKFLAVKRSTEDISSIAGITTLESVYLSENNIKTLEPLRDCTGLKELEINANQLTSLDGLENCVLLHNLDVRGNQISDISAIENCEGLSSVYLSYNQINDISPLARADKLWKLYIDNNEITDMSALSGCEKLTWFEAQNNKIEDISALSASKDSLKYLNISGNNITNLDPLSSHIVLEEVSASNNAITSIQGLENCTQLKKVSLNNNKIGDISVLAKSAEKLEDLQLENNLVSDISPLTGTTALTFLALDGNAISDISPLGKSIMLENLFLHDNQISSIQAISGLTELKRLDLSDNQISGISSLLGINPANSPIGGLYIDLSNNSITDISSLPDTTPYSALYLDNNPIKDFSRIKALKHGAVSFTYLNEVDYSPLKESERSISKVFYAVDTPLDKQVELKNTLNELMNAVNFVSTEEIRAYKQAKRDELTGLKKSDEAQEEAAITTEDANE